MTKYEFIYIKNYLKEKLYPFAHSDGVFTDKEETITLTETLNEIFRKLEIIADTAQSDWHELDETSNSFIKNKPSSLPANGGNADTLNGKTFDEFSLKSDYDSHLADITAHQDLFSKKIDSEIANMLIKEPAFEPDTGVLSFTRLNGTTIFFNIPKSLIFKSALFDEESNEIVITWSDESKSRIPCEGLIDIYTGSENDVIQITVDDNNKIAAIVKSGSITLPLLSHDVRDVLDNSQNHMTNKSNHLPEGASDGKILGVVSGNYTWIDMPNGGDSENYNYNNSINKPLINNVELTGNKTLTDLGITASSIGADVEGSAEYALESAKSFINLHNSDSSKHIPNDGLSGQILGMTDDGIEWVNAGGSGSCLIKPAHNNNYLFKVIGVSGNPSSYFSLNCPGNSIVQILGLYSTEKKYVANIIHMRSTIGEKLIFTPSGGCVTTSIGGVDYFVRTYKIHNLSTSSYTVSTTNLQIEILDIE